MNEMETEKYLTQEQMMSSIAVVGMAGRFPGASDIYQFWDNLLQGRCAVQIISDEKLAKQGVLREKFQSKKFVNKAYPLEKIDQFDAAYFRFTPREAELMDPQQRLLLETAIHTFENAGYIPSAMNGLTSVFIANSISTYLHEHLLKQDNFDFSLDNIQLLVGNDSPATHLSFRLNLNGPSISVNTTCSSSLVAVHLACQSLLNYESDCALAGGAWINVAQEKGYLYHEGSILSPDGICRPFDASANGTVGGNGLGLVLLKRLEDAIRDEDHIWGIIRGSAVNNDGSDKVGYTAPSVSGQSAVIRSALQTANVDPSEVDYIEAHGTGTKMGDPIEALALKQIFKKKENYRCGIGALKANIGHLNTASGISGLIKALLCVYHRKVPPSIHFKKNNPALELEDSPLYVCDQLKTWNRPITLGVSSFGIGGTNAHAIIQSISKNDAKENRPDQTELFIFSAKTQESLRLFLREMIHFLGVNPDLNPSDVAFTLRQGREAHCYRKTFIARGLSDLSNQIQRFLSTSEELVRETLAPTFIFLFPGQGDHYVQMSAWYYQNIPEFRHAFQACSDWIQMEYQFDLVHFLFSTTMDHKLWTQVSLFVVEYSLGVFWIEKGFKPSVMLGHSLGEYVAATLSGVMSIEVALSIIVKRSELVAGLADGVMIAVSASKQQLESFLRPEVSLAVENGPNECVLSMNIAAVEQVEKDLRDKKLPYKKLALKSAFHSHMLNPILSEFELFMKKQPLEAMQIPLISNLTGQLADAHTIITPEYWVAHLRQTVCFREAMDTLNKHYSGGIILELGPGRFLTSLTSRYLDKKRYFSIATLSPMKRVEDEERSFFAVPGALWEHGISVNWELFFTKQARRIPLPGYAFEPQSYWFGSIPSSSKKNIPQPTDNTSENLDITREIQLIWQKTMGIDLIGSDDNFFTIGGHSLFASQILWEIEKRLQVQLTYADLFNHPSPNELSKQILLLKTKNGAETFSPERVTSKTIRRSPLSVQQNSMLFMERYSDSPSVNNIPMAFYLEGELDINALQSAFSYLLIQHDILRCKLEMHDGIAYQVIQDQVELDWSVENYFILEDEQKNWMTERIQLESKIPFDLQKPSWMRIRLFVLGKNRNLLLWTVHHLIVDGWSCGILFDDLQKQYSQFSAGRAFEPLVSVSNSSNYFDYVHWQQTWMSSSENYQKALTQECEALKLFPMYLELPFDFMRPKERNYAGSAYIFSLPENLTRTLNAFSRKQGVTLYMSLLTLFYVFLRRLSGQDQIVIGTPIANREDRRFDRCIGLFLNTIAIGVDGKDQESFLAILDIVRNTVLDRFSHQSIPFDRVVETLKLSRKTNVHPVFQVMFALQNAGKSLFSLDEVKATPLSELSSAEKNYSRFDLSLMAEQTEKQIKFTFNYANDLFQEDTIFRFSQYFVRMIDALMENPNALVDEMDYLSRDDVAQLNSFSNRKPEKKSVDLDTLTELIDAKIENFHHIYAEDYRGSYTYADIIKKSNQLAHYMMTQGCTVGSVIAVLLPRSADILLAFFAALKLGCAYLYCEPSNPADRIRFMLTDSNSCLLITDTSERAKLFSNEIQCLVLDVTKNSIEEMPVTCPKIFISGDNIAYLIYTSGTTGRPKGVAVTHSNVLNFLRGMHELLKNYLFEKIVCVASFSFDIVVFDIYYSFFQDTSVWIATEEQQRDPKLLLPALNKNDAVICFNATPTFLKNFIDSYELHFAELGKAQPSFLFHSVGEPLPPTLAKKLLQFGILLNGYGPTENTVISTEAIIHDPEKITIGKPLLNITAYVLDRKLQKVPIGVMGELYLGGRSLSTGYLNRPDANEKSFIQNPFGEGKLYKTGDHVSWTADGELKYFGRIDHQVKVHGYRIELTEIETVISETKEVEQAVVKVEFRASGDPMLVAFVLGTASLNDIKNNLRKRLPAYMVPSHIFILMELPLTDSGKIDRKKLSYEALLSTVEKNVARPHTPLEEQLCRLFGRLLNRKKVGVDDNFFDLGGDSIMTMQLVHHAAKEGISLRVAHLFEYPTVAKLSAYLGSIDNTPLAFLEGQQKSFSGILPLTPIQHFFFSLPLSNIHHNNQSILLKPSKRLDAELCEKVVRRLIHYHEMLRAKYHQQSGQWVQRIQDLKEYSAALQTFFIEKSISSLASSIHTETTRLHQQLNIESGNIFLVALLNLDNGEQRLLFVGHHLVMDGSSMRLLLDDFSTLYQSLNSGELIGLPDKPSSYLDWSFALQKYAGTKDALDEVNYWQNQYDRFAAELPLDFTGRHTIETSHTVRIELTAEQTSYFLKNFQSTTDQTTNVVDILMTCLILSYQKTFERNQLCFMTDQHGRIFSPTAMDVSRTLGWFTSLFPINLSISECSSFMDALTEVVKVRRGIPHGGVGYGILRYLHPTQLKDHQTAGLRFNYLGQWSDSDASSQALFSMASESAGETIDPKSIRPFLLDINAEIRHEKLSVTWRYGENCHKRSTIEKFSQNYYHYLLQFLSNPLTKMNQGEGRKNSIFCVHPVGGQVYWYTSLAHQFTQPFWALKANSLHYLRVEDNAPSGIPAIAKCYLDQVKMYQSNGTYYLTGWSFGALVAFEMAHQLLKSGQNDFKLVMIDPTYAEGFWKTCEDPLEALGFFSSNESIWLRPLKFILADYLALDIDVQISEILQCIKPEIKNLPDFNELIRIHLLNVNAMFHYRPEVLDHTVHVVGTTDSIAKCGRSDLGWGKWVGRSLEVYEVEGTHYSILESPRVNQVSNFLKKVFNIH